MNAEGVALAAWAGTAYPQPDAIEASMRRTPAGPWERATTFSDIPEIDPPAAALDAAGNALILWTDNVRNQVRLYASFRPAVGSWEQRVELGAGFPAVEDLRVAFDGAGNATALWEAGAGRIETAYRPFGGTWTEPEAVLVGLPAILRLRSVVTESGDALTVWNDQRGIRSAFRRALSHVWQVSEITDVPNPPDNFCCLLDVDADARGDAVAVWSGGPPYQTILAAIRPASGRWQPPIVVGRGDGHVESLSVDTDATGDAAAVWEREIDNAGEIHSFVEVAELRAHGPLIETVTVPKTMRARATVRFSVRVAPWGLPVRRAPRWQFGDGTTATGSAVRHVYRRAGTYTVVVTARDARGATSATRTVVVPRSAAR